MLDTLAETDCREKYEYGSAAAYAEAVRNWMIQTQCWYDAQRAAAQRVYLTAQSAAFVNVVQPIAAVAAAHVQRLRAMQEQGRIPVLGGAPQITANYRIPSLFRRFAAEAIDMFLSSVAKIAVMFILIEMDLIDLDQYEKVLSDEADFGDILDFTQDFIPIELAAKIVLALVEAYCISFGGLGAPPGATPGKSMMGILVIPCREIVQLPDGVVRVTGELFVPPNRSCLRSLLKNLLVSFLFPINLFAYGFPFSRSIYDVASSTVVVALP